jgi:hypothetical protein
LVRPPSDGAGAVVLMAVDSKNKDADSKPSDSIEPKYVTPSQEPGRFRRAPSGTGIDNEDGGVWEKDKAGNKAHGGEQWKRWPGQKDWEKGKNRESVWPNGVVLSK